MAEFNDRRPQTAQQRWEENKLNYRRWGGEHAQEKGRRANVYFNREHNNWVLGSSSPHFRGVGDESFTTARSYEDAVRMAMDRGFSGKGGWHSENGLPVDAAGRPLQVGWPHLEPNPEADPRSHRIPNPRRRRA